MEKLFVHHINLCSWIKPNFYLSRALELGQGLNWMQALSPRIRETMLHFQQDPENHRPQSLKSDCLCYFCTCDYKEFKASIWEIPTPNFRWSWISLHVQVIAHLVTFIHMRNPSEVKQMYTISTNYMYNIHRFQTLTWKSFEACRTQTIHLSASLILQEEQIHWREKQTIGD